jgi:spore coat protein CotH
VFSPVRKIVGTYGLPVIFFFFTFQTTSAQHPGDRIFSGIQVHEINIRFSDADYWKRLSDDYNAGSNEYVMASVTVNGKLLDSVGVRFKGNSSFRHLNSKKPFKLKFDRFKNDQRWDGLAEVHLNNAWNDPTLMREKIHLDLCGVAGIPAPRCNFVRLSINDEYFALYSVVEQVDKIFLQTRFDSKDGFLFKAIDGLKSSASMRSDFRWRGPDRQTYQELYELKSGTPSEAWTLLLALIEAIHRTNGVETGLDQMMSVEPLCMTLAVDNFLGNFDSYAGSARNFYVYYDPLTRRWEWIVWDVGLSFGLYALGASGSTAMDFFYDGVSSQRPLLHHIMSTPALRHRYERALCKLYQTVVETGYLDRRIDTLATIIRPFAYEDRKKAFTNEQFEDAIIRDVVAGGVRKPGLKSFIEARKKKLMGEVGCAP